MRTFAAALLAAAAVAFAACAPAPNRPAEPAIWRVTDADSEIWLFGSVHLLPPDLRWRGPRVNAAFAAADELVTETDMSEAASRDFPALAARYGALPEGDALSARLAPEDRARLARVTARMGVDAAALEGLRPWLAALQLSIAYAVREGHRAETGVEAVLLAEARAQGKRVSFLETPEEQVRVLADLAPEDETRFLALTLRQIEEDADTLDALDRVWASGDVAALERALAAQWDESGAAVHEAVILRRNRAWADAIARRLDGEGRVFVAVGAAHLVGEDSVIALLRQRGITVEGA
jgi:uncharacterized protein YbaP (TraB family)